MRPDDRFEFGRWNPVKELKDSNRREVLSAVDDVESGEGIER